MKKCPYCVEEIQDDAQKCKHCGEFFVKKDPKMHNTFKDYEKWLKQNYPAYDIVSEDKEEKIIVLNKEYKPFNIIVFILLLLLWVLPGLIYAAVTLLKDKIITLTIYFDKNGKVIKINHNNFKFLMDNYNNSFQNKIK